MTRPFPLHTGIAEVTAIAAITPSMARFTLSHPAFADFGVEEPGEIVTLGWSDDDEELVLPLRRCRRSTHEPTRTCTGSRRMRSSARCRTSSSRTGRAPCEAAVRRSR
jgi:NADPH-dependent ferric siderophore reductase